MNESRKLLIDPFTLEPYRSCTNCRHFDPRGLPRCAAFPAGIPLPIIGGDVAHDRPLPGDHGIQFEPVDGEPYLPLEDDGAEFFAARPAPARAS